MNTIYFTKGTSNDYKKAIIKQLVLKGNIVHISLPQRVVYGKLVGLGDYQDLLKKGFVRMVSSAKLDYYKNDKNKVYTKIFSFEEFQEIKVYEETEVAAG